MKNTYSPLFPPPPRPFLLPNVNTSGSNPNPNQSNTKIDHSKYRSWPRLENAGFVKSVRRTSSQLFKKDKKDGDAASRNSSSSISALVSEALNVSTAHTTPSLLRRFSRSHSKRSGAVSIVTVNWDPPKGYSEDKTGGKGCTHSPIGEVASVSPVITEPPAPTSPLEETGNEENMCPETTSDDPDLLSLPLPPSPPCPPSPLVELVDPVQSPDDPQGVDPFFHHNDPPLSDDWSVTSSSGHLRLPTTTDIALTTPPTDRTVQPPLAQLPPSSAPAAPDPDRDEDEEILEPCISPLAAPTTSSPTANARLSYLVEPVFAWWLSKDISSYPYLYF